MAKRALNVLLASFSCMALAMAQAGAQNYQDGSPTSSTPITQPVMHGPVTHYDATGFFFANGHNPGDYSPVVTVTRGGTGATTLNQARANLNSSLVVFSYSQLIALPSDGVQIPVGTVASISPAVGPIVSYVLTAGQAMNSGVGDFGSQYPAGSVTSGYYWNLIRPAVLDPHTWQATDGCVTGQNYANAVPWNNMIAYANALVTGSAYVEISGGGACYAMDDQIGPIANNGLYIHGFQLQPTPNFNIGNPWNKAIINISQNAGAITLRDLFIDLQRMPVYGLGLAAPGLISFEDIDIRHWGGQYSTYGVAGLSGGAPGSAGIQNDGGCVHFYGKATLDMSRFTCQQFIAADVEYSDLALRAGYSMEWDGTSGGSGGNFVQLQGGKEVERFEPTSAGGVKFVNSYMLSGVNGTTGATTTVTLSANALNGATSISYTSSAPLTVNQAYPVAVTRNGYISTSGTFTPTSATQGTFSIGLSGNVAAGVIFGVSLNVAQIDPVCVHVVDNGTQAPNSIISFDISTFANCKIVVESDPKNPPNFALGFGSRFINTPIRTTGASPVPGAATFTPNYGNLYGNYINITTSGPLTSYANVVVGPSVDFPSLNSTPPVSNAPYLFSLNTTGNGSWQRQGCGSSNPTALPYGVLYKMSTGQIPFLTGNQCVSGGGIQTMGEFLHIPVDMNSGASNQPFVVDQYCDDYVTALGAYSATLYLTNDAPAVCELHIVKRTGSSTTFTVQAAYQGVAPTMQLTLSASISAGQSAFSFTQAAGAGGGSLTIGQVYSIYYATAGALPNSDTFTLTSATTGTLTNAATGSIASGQVLTMGPPANLNGSASASFTLTQNIPCIITLYRNPNGNSAYADWYSQGCKATSN